MVTVLALGTIGSVRLTVDQIVKVGLTMVMSWLYMSVFFLLAMCFAIWLPNANHALLLTIIVWLVFAFIFPQIGDTMDLDNQLPGGFFASMGMNKAQETAALQQFKWYETIRNGVEELSPPSTTSGSASLFWASRPSLPTIPGKRYFTLRRST